MASQIPFIAELGLTLTPHSSNLGGIYNLWLNSADGNKLYLGAAAVGGGSLPTGTTKGSLLTWDDTGSAWVENASVTAVGGVVKADSFYGIYGGKLGSGTTMFTVAEPDGYNAAKLEVVWNDDSSPSTGLLVYIADTLSEATSLALDVQIGVTRLFSISKTGNVIAGGGAGSGDAIIGLGESRSADGSSALLLYAESGGGVSARVRRTSGEDGTLQIENNGFGALEIVQVDNAPILLYTGGDLRMSVGVEGNVSVTGDLFVAGQLIVQSAQRLSKRRVTLASGDVAGTFDRCIVYITAAHATNKYTLPYAPEDGWTVVIANKDTSLNAIIGAQSSKEIRDLSTGTAAATFDQPAGTIRTYVFDSTDDEWIVG